MDFPEIFESLEQGDIDNAIEQLNLQNNKDSVLFYFSTIGCNYIESGNPEKALKFLKKLIIICEKLKLPQSLPLHLTHVGYAHAMKGESDKPI